MSKSRDHSNNTWHSCGRGYGTVSPNITREREGLSLSFMWHFYQKLLINMFFDKFKCRVTHLGEYRKCQQGGRESEIIKKVSQNVPRIIWMAPYPYSFFILNSVNVVVCTKFPRNMTKSFYHSNFHFRKTNHLKKTKVWSSVRRFPTTSASGLTKMEPFILCNTRMSQDRSEYSECTRKNEENFFSHLFSPHSHLKA